MVANKYIDVFKAHPTAKQIFVVDGQPFLDEAQAKNFARGTKNKIETIERPSEADLKEVKEADLKEVKEADLKEVKEADLKGK